MESQKLERTDHTSGESFRASEESLSRENSEKETLEDDEKVLFNEDVITDLSQYEEGKIVRGTVIAVTGDSVFVDIGYKSEGEIPKAEFSDDPVQGAQIEVMIMRMESREGRVILSKQKADEIISWEKVVKAFNENMPVKGRVTDTTRGGFRVIVEDSFQGFLPNSQASLKKLEDSKSLIGKELLFKIDKLEGKNNIVVSHKRYLEEMKEKKIEEFFDTKRVGDTVEGIVKDIVNYGAFIDLGGVDGLLHVNDMSWGKVVDPKKYLQKMFINKNEEIRCVILSLNKEDRKVSLGLKQLSPNPWDTFEQRYQRGQRYRGTVTKLASFGAFVELEEGVEGLVHISELSWTKRIKHPKEVLKVGQIAEVMLLDYDLNKKTVSLGLKQVLPNPWDELELRYPAGSKVKTRVKRATNYGVFLELEKGIEGLLHIDDISWTKQVKKPSELYKKGDIVDAIVLSIDKESKRINLGLKQLKDNPWKSLKEKHPKGSVVSGTVTSIVDFGVFVKIDEDIEGLIHISQLANERVEDPHKVCKVGDEIKAVVLNIDEKKRKITLSVKEYLNHLEEQEITKYLDSGEDKTATVKIGDIINMRGIGE